MKKSTQLELLMTLKKIINTRANRRPAWFRPSYGLCYNIEQLSGRSGHGYYGLYGIVGSKMIQSWDKYSGCAEYPVPATNLPTPLQQYSYQQDLYDRRSPYCRLRHELLDYLIARVEGQ